MGSYTDFLKKRLLSSVITLVGLSLLIFFLARILPGDPALAALGEFASKEQLEAFRKELWLDKPLHLQYFKFIYDLLNFRLGLSVLTWHDVAYDISLTFPATFELILTSMVLAIVIGPALGVISATKSTKLSGTFSRVFSVFGVAFPRFFLCIILQLIFAFWLSLLPAGGRLSPWIDKPLHITGLYLIDSLLTLRFDIFLDALSHIILPALSLALSPIAQLAALTYAKMADELKKDYVIAFKANKIPEKIIYYKYALKNAFSASLTTIGLFFGAFFEGAFATELIFQWPGMARYVVRAATRSDFNAVVGCALTICAVYVIVNFIIDILYGYLDPRVVKRYGVAASP